MKHKRYFSLIEIVIVVIVISFIFGIAVVQLDSLIPSSRLKKQVRDTANLMEMATAQAAIEGRELKLVFDLNERMMKLEYYFIDEEAEELFIEQQTLILESEEKDVDPDEILAPLYETKWEDSIELVSLDVDVAEDEEMRDFIIFSPQGMSDGAKLKWKEASGISQELEIWPLLGKIEISEVSDSLYD